jgi:hypothetical protein
MLHKANHQQAVSYYPYPSNACNANTAVQPLLSCTPVIITEPLSSLAPQTCAHAACRCSKTRANTHTQPPATSIDSIHTITSTDAGITATQHPANAGASASANEQRTSASGTCTGNCCHYTVTVSVDAIVVIGCRAVREGIQAQSHAAAAKLHCWEAQQWQLQAQCHSAGPSTCWRRQWCCVGLMLRQWC